MKSNNLIVLMLCVAFNSSIAFRFSKSTLCMNMNVNKFEISKLNLYKKTAIASILGFALNYYPLNTSPVSADARLNAPTAAGTRVNSDAESLLRYGLPFENKDIRELQQSIESVKADLKTRRITFAKIDVQNSKKVLKTRGESIIKAMPSSHVKDATESLERLKADLIPLEESINEEAAAGTGSQQERGFLDEAFTKQDIVAKELTVLEELMVPSNYQREVPSEYSNLPRLTGRAEVEMVVTRPDGSKFDVDGKLYDELKLKMVIDGYNAPVTGGNFIDLINKGFYKNKPITRSDGFVVQTGDADPAGTVHGYVPPGSKTERIVPLEISLKGEPNLLYGITSEDDSRGYAATTLPFQSYGALGMARSEFEADSASSQFFWLLFESDLTPAGKNMLDGRYTCFGYTVDGADFLKDVKEGDIIKSATVTKGSELLVLPK